VCPPFFLIGCGRDPAGDLGEGLMPIGVRANELSLARCLIVDARQHVDSWKDVGFQPLMM
jgi:hypothetical protein